MIVLQDVKNEIIIHNGQVEKQNITENITIDGNTITIVQATNIAITYIGSASHNSTIYIDVQSPRLDIFESYEYETTATLKKYFQVHQGCQVTRYIDNQSKESSLHIEDQVVVEKKATVACAYVEMSDSSIEAKCTYNLIGEGADVKLRLAALAKEKEKKHYVITLNHMAPYTSGIMDNYGVVKDSSSLVIDGIGTIKKGNRQSSSHQVNKIIVFDNTCNAKANPYLYIDEYDVKASHGASVGKIDEEHLYYLQSRGLSRNTAMHLVTYGYFLPVLEFIKDKQLQEQFSTTLKEKVGI